MFEVHATVLGTQQLAFGIQGLKRDVVDLRPLARPFNDEFHRIELRQFTSEGAVGRKGAWPPLSKRYADWKARHYPGAPILVRTGRLKESLTGDTGDTLFEGDDPSRIVLGTRVPYAIYHQQGSGHLPVRRPVDLVDEHQVAFAKIVQKHVNQDVFKKHFFAR